MGYLLCLQPNDLVIQVEMGPFCIQINWREYREGQKSILLLWQHWSISGWPQLPVFKTRYWYMCNVNTFIWQWELSDSLICKLEQFLGELSKTSLKWPKHLSKTCAVLTLGMKTIRCRILCRKLNFLKNFLEDRATSLGTVAMNSLSDEVE